MYADDLTKYLKELSYLEYFKGQIMLEDNLIKSYQKNLLDLSVEDPSFQLKYARLQGQVEALKNLSGTRSIITNSEKLPSVNKGKSLNV